ncbi:hypothetical protein GDO78_002994 [Eleutherodactylus coqui]|uniref:Uncharacterized protein n=1 Tax=Eleutherodactylus coqui TaxID=57060 RepID=A0A8J6EWI9_ELECQ|nr:hypothetical protein GDO78_002994 [Eleutherodactylus coqui]
MKWCNRSVQENNHRTPLTLQFLIFFQQNCKLEHIHKHFTKNKYQTDWKRTLKVKKVLKVQYLITGKIYPARNVSSYCLLHTSAKPGQHL